MDEIIMYFKKCLNQYADFNGRARRKEYWSFALVNFGVAIILSILAWVFASNFLGTLFSGISSLISLALLIPSLAVAVRRLHDLGKSGWYLLIILIPLAGPIILLVWLFTDGQPGTNMYGPNPKNPANDLHELGQDPYKPQQFTS